MLDQLSNCTAELGMFRHARDAHYVVVVSISFLHIFFCFFFFGFCTVSESISFVGLSVLYFPVANVF